MEMNVNSLRVDEIDHHHHISTTGLAMNNNNSGVASSAAFFGGGGGARLPPECAAGGGGGGAEDPFKMVGFTRAKAAREDGHGRSCSGRWAGGDNYSNCNDLALMLGYGDPDSSIHNYQFVSCAASGAASSATPYPQRFGLLGGDGGYGLMGGATPPLLETGGVDSILCRARAKRGCATHPRSIAERVRRTKISERMKKLQDLVPNLDKQAHTADMLDEVVEYVKQLQQQVQVLSQSTSKCKGKCQQKPDLKQR